MSTRPLRFAIKSWLTSIGCPQYAPLFINAGIDTYELVSQLDPPLLRELGVVKVGDSVRIMRLLVRMRTQKAAKPDVAARFVARLSNIRKVDDGYYSDEPATRNSDVPSLTEKLKALAENPRIEKILALLAPVDESNKHIAVFILLTGHVKKINTLECFTADSIKKKVLKKLGFKLASPEKYNVYFVDEHDNIHLMFDVELVSLVRSSDRVERNRIIFCRSGEDPSAEALELLRCIQKRFESKKSSSAPQVSDKYINVNTSSSQSRRKKAKDPHRRNKDLKPLYEQRPPSELILTNLAEYFPEAPSKELQRTVRNLVRYLVRMLRAFLRVSTMLRGSIITLQNSPRTVGDVWMNAALELDEAVLGDDKDFLDFVGGYKRPKSRFVPSNAPPLPDIDSPDLDRQVRRKRMLVVVGSGKDSKVELLDLDQEILDESESAEGFKKEPGFAPDTGPESWLKGKRIGAGSFGVVYLGLNSFTGELMAVKQVEIPRVKELKVSQTLKGNSSDSTLKADQETLKEAPKDRKQAMIDALQREMALLKELKHEKIVRYLGSSSDGTYLNIFLEYVPGGLITSMLNNYGPFKEPLIRNFTSQILIGLKYLHSKSIIHRDIKGGNILIDNTGGAKISDFGISKKMETSIQAKRASLQGSVYWMAPEVVRQIAHTEKSDIWSVGCLIIEMFTGKHPFPEFSQMQAIFRIGTHTTPELPENCTPECKDFLKKTFTIDYRERPSAKDLLKHPFLNRLIMLDK